MPRHRRYRHCRYPRAQGHADAAVPGQGQFNFRARGDAPACLPLPELKPARRPFAYPPMAAPTLPPEQGYWAFLWQFATEMIRAQIGWAVLQCLIMLILLGAVVLLGETWGVVVGGVAVWLLIWGLRTLAGSGRR